MKKNLFLRTLRAVKKTGIVLVLCCLPSVGFLSTQQETPRTDARVLGRANADLTPVFATTEAVSPKAPSIFNFEQEPAPLFSVIVGAGVANDTIQMVLERSAGGIYLSGDLHFDLPEIVKNALEKSIPMFFVAQTSINRKRWYWRDAQVANATKHMRLAYQPLTRRWRLHVSAQPLSNTGLGLTLSQTFDELADAMHAVQRISRWRVADLAALVDEGDYQVIFKFSLDDTQLPIPIHLGMADRTNWSLAFSRSLSWVQGAQP